jgi:hypothetical protein
VHEKLERMTPAQRKALWKRIHAKAPARGLPVGELERSPVRPTRRRRKMG